MKKYYFALAVLALTSAGFFYASGTAAKVEAQPVVAAEPFLSPNIVISQIYGGGGLTGAQYTHDYVELFNRGTSPVNLNGWSVQYASATGTNWLPAFPLPNFELQPGRYFLIQFASNGANRSALPTPDFIATVLQPEGFIPNLSSSTGKLAAVNNSTRLPVNNCPVDPSIVDFLGYGTSASCFEGAGRAPALTATTALKRNADGCSDGDNNSTDFAVVAPAPRNSASPTNTCNLGAILQAGISANPNNVTPPATTLLAVSVIPATTPPSTNITVTGNLSDIGGPSSQPFFDNGTNGDVTPGDNVYSFLATVPAGTSGGTHFVTAVAADAQGRQVPLNQNITVNAPLPNENPLLFGNPSNATGEIANENNYLMQKPPYSLSYSRAKATANWVAWRLDSSWIGTANNGDFDIDNSLPAAWYRVTPDDYSEPVYDRGHMCPSGDRTNTQANNSLTFLMTNIIPQHPDNNQGPWVDFETYCRTLASQGQEIYIITGPTGNIGTIGATQQNRVVIPATTWKVVLVLPNGNNDLQRASARATRVFGIVIPNVAQNRNTPWRTFRVTVDQVEYLTGYDFFSLIPKNTQEIIERRRDKQ